MEPVSSILFSLYRGTQQHGEWIVACLEGAWPGIVGERLAEVCRPLAFKDSNLVVEITDMSWEKAVKSVKRDMAEKLRAATSGEVQSISLKRSH
jgi:hypothetical protein